MNTYFVRCPGCGEDLQEMDYEGRTILVHPGYTPGTQLRVLRETCIEVVNYVRFSCPDRHCCPETYAVCPKCWKGKPSETLCKL